MPKKYLIALILTALVISAALLGYILSQPPMPNPPAPSPSTSNPSTPSPSLPAPSVSVDELLSAPEQIEIDDRQYILGAYLNRDFMPSIQPDRSSLVASVTINATDLQEFPSSIDANMLWVIKSPEEIWETTFTNEDRNPNYNYQLEKIARDGPKWEPNIQVDVVVRIFHEGDKYLLKASNQTIHKTD